MKHLHGPVDHIVHFVDARDMDITLTCESTLLHYVRLAGHDIGISCGQVDLLTRIQQECLSRLAAKYDHLMRTRLQGEASRWTRIHKV